MKPLLTLLLISLGSISHAADRIIEVATIVTDAELNVIAEGPALAVHQGPAVLALMDDWNRATHGASGLLARVRASTLDEGAVGRGFQERGLAGAGEALAGGEAEEREPEALVKSFAAPEAPAPDLIGADVDHPAVRVPEPVDARGVGYGSGCRSVGRGFGHVPAQLRRA